MFNEEVSYFEHYNSDPETIQLYEWLDACMDDDTYKEKFDYFRTEFSNQIQQGLPYPEIRAALDKKGYTKFKRSLPLITVGAVCEGGRKDKHVAHKTGWVALDIDLKDNPHLFDFEAVRREISKIVYVAFCALSASGNGVWALVKIKYPERQKEYFQQLEYDFKQRGVLLDNSKGKNPNDARFLTYDANAFITDDFRIYDRLPNLTKVKPKAPVSVSHSNDVFEFAMNLVKKEHGYTFTHPGDMHNSLFHFCSILHWKGVPRTKAEKYIDENILSLSKITTNCISGAYKDKEYFGKGVDVRTMNIVG
ncbi:BT4734/BF3469 family protein [Rhodohalobacter sp. 8-1]|uniref:BT4734/BF3469 family protein n=1 Tax=Rhodohalobacter sp. 8-1 TaxID=3131972 RepID=UPI0030EB6765